MSRASALPPGIRRVDGPLPYLLSTPPPGEAGAAPTEPFPLLVFLHGLDEGAPEEIVAALSRHGPLARSAAGLARQRFVIATPQLPLRGDHWYRYAAAVEQIVGTLASTLPLLPGANLLTGFSFGGNGALDLGVEQPDLWRAVWAVDPTRVPASPLQPPLWISGGSVARRNAERFRATLELEFAGGETGPAATRQRVWEDAGLDHVGTARAAYSGDRVYRWMLDRLSLR
jgi:hypothetical protein